MVSDRVLLMLSGKARLLGKHNGKLSTLAILKPGNLVGLPSLFRGTACEEISASSAVQAYSLPDTLIADLYSEEESFRNWCDKTVFVAEVAYLLEAILRQIEKSDYEVLDTLSLAMEETKLLQEHERSAKNVEEGRMTYMASSNTDIPIDSLIKNIDDLPSSEGPFNVDYLLRTFLKN